MRGTTARRAGCLVSAAGAVVLLLACGKEQAEPPPPVRPVLSLVVTPERVRVFAPFIGTIEPRYQTALGFRISGRMVSRNANVGDRVTKGSVLASLDPRVQQFALTSSKADLANAAAQLANATASEQRQRALLATQAVAQSQVDSAVAARDTAQARVNQAQASLVKAQEQSDYTALRSDYDGVITSWSLEVGQVVSAGQTVVTVARPDIRDAVFDVPDELVAKAPAGTSFRVALQADLSVTVAGVVREIAPQADAATRTRRLRLTLDDAPPSFRLGTTVTITLATDEPPTIRIPRTAILDKDGSPHVWLVQAKGTVGLAPVTLGAAQGEAVVVTAGLSAGDRVVTAGVHSLSDGQTIKLVEP